MPGSGKLPDNEEKFLEAVTTDEAFRNALKDKRWDKVSEELDRIDIQVQDKNAVLDAIKKIDWSDLKTLEDRLHRGGVHPMN